MKNVRRKDREITTEEAALLLDRGEFGVLSTAGADGQPYGVPFNYVHKNGCLYFHCALNGEKTDNLATNPKVSFCVVGHTRLLPEQFSTKYESAIAFGTASEVDEDERYAALVWLLEKYSPEFVVQGKEYIARKEKATRVIKIAISHLSGKARK